jgi:hypothetical protein
VQLLKAEPTEVWSRATASNSCEHRAVLLAHEIMVRWGHIFIILVAHYIGIIKS